MFTAMYFLTRKDGMTRAEFEEFWLNVHGPIARTMPGLREYTQYHLGTTPDGSEPPFDGVAILSFDSPEAMEAAWASAEGQATLDDAPKFIVPDKLWWVPVEAKPV